MYFWESFLFCLSTDPVLGILKIVLVKFSVTEGFKLYIWSKCFSQGTGLKGQTNSPKAYILKLLSWLLWQLLYSRLLDNVKIFWKICWMVNFHTYTKFCILTDDLTTTAAIWKMHLKKILGKSSFVKLLQWGIRGVAN